MSSLQKKLEGLFNDKLKKEFQKYCFLLQAYSDRDSAVYECDFSLDDEIYWDPYYKFNSNQGVEMTPLIEYFFKEILPRYITTDSIGDEIYENHKYSNNDLTQHGWIYFTLYPKSQKFEIDVSYDTFVDEDRGYEDTIDDILSSTPNMDQYETEIQEAINKGSIFIIGYEGGGDSGYLDDDCIFEDNVTKNERIEAPDFILNLGYKMISTYERGYELDDGGRGEIHVNFKTGMITMLHTEFSRMSDNITIFEIDL